MVSRLSVIHDFSILAGSVVGTLGGAGLTFTWAYKEAETIDDVLIIVPLQTMAGAALGAAIGASFGFLAPVAVPIALTGYAMKKYEESKQ